MDDGWKDTPVSASLANLRAPNAETMISRRLLAGATLCCVAIGITGLLLYLQQREARCDVTPGRPNLITFIGQAGMPEGWTRRAGGVELRGPAVDGEGFDLDGDGRAMQLLGIGNFLQTPPVAVEPGERFCFSGFALTDSIQRSPTRLRLTFAWRDRDGRLVQQDQTEWQMLVVWSAEAPPHDWSPILGSFVAPTAATTLVVQIAPASDDRVYLDRMQIRRGGSGLAILSAPSSPGCC
jgi:hypothetical protein